MWQPLSLDEFEAMYCQQQAELQPDLLGALLRFRVPVCRATIRRSAEAGDESVFVVAKTKYGVLYYDDVENGFNFSPVDADDRLLRPGGSQMDLSDAVRSWLRPLVEDSDWSDSPS